MRGGIVLTVEEAIKIWQKTKSPYLKRDMEKFIRKERRRIANNENRKKQNQSHNKGSEMDFVGRA